MIVLDADILLYAYDESAAHHRKARIWLEGTLSAGGAVGLPWQTVGAFLRIVTNPKLPGMRFTMDEAVDIVNAWLDQPGVRLMGPGEDHWPILRRALIDGQARGALVTDAQLAALTIECGGTLYSTDRDFARFTGLRFVNPLT